VTVKPQSIASLDTPVFAVPEEALVPVNGYPASQVTIPQSKMFVIKKLLENYRAKEGANAVTYDASQGDGGASLPGVPHELLDRANEMQKKNMARMPSGRRRLNSTGNLTHQQASDPRISPLRMADATP